MFVREGREVGVGVEVRPVRDVVAAADAATSSFLPLSSSPLFGAGRDSNDPEPSSVLVPGSLDPSLSSSRAANLLVVAAAIVAAAFGLLLPLLFLFRGIVASEGGKNREIADATSLPHGRG